MHASIATNHISSQFSTLALFSSWQLFVWIMYSFVYTK
jgi:hypothetical protein